MTLIDGIPRMQFQAAVKDLHRSVRVQCSTEGYKTQASDVKFPALDVSISAPVRFPGPDLRALALDKRPQALDVKLPLLSKPAVQNHTAQLHYAEHTARIAWVSSSQST